jgi:hypothetical protein
VADAVGLPVRDAQRSLLRLDPFNYRYHHSEAVFFRQYCGSIADCKTAAPVWTHRSLLQPELTFDCTMPEHKQQDRSKDKAGA